MKLIREMKVSDDNYGNTTKRIELNIPASKFPLAESLLDEWEALVRSGMTLELPDEDLLPGRIYKEKLMQYASFERVLKDIAALEDVQND